MQFREISKDQHLALVQMNKDNKTKFRKSAINSLAELNHDGFPDHYKYILISILKLLGVELNLVLEYPTGDPRGAHLGASQDPPPGASQDPPPGELQDPPPGELQGDALLHLDSRYEIVWRIINEYTSLVKLAIEGKPVGPGDKILTSNLYIDHIKATTPCTAVKTIILVALLNLFSERKIEPNGSFECKDYYIHKKLNILLNSIVLFDKDKY